MDDNWDDWFVYRTVFVLFYFDELGVVRRIGELKIGQFNINEEQSKGVGYRPDIPKEFDALGEEFFSIGQDATFYESLAKLNKNVREKILAGLRDMAFNSELFDKALGEKVTGLSLLRSVSRQSVKGQFYRMARGGARLTPYSFSFISDQHRDPSEFNCPTFSFEVKPDSKPPTNIHVIIGRNGVGKTYHLNLMTEALLRGGENTRGRFTITQSDDDLLDDEDLIFENIVSVTFSAFDPFEPLSVKRNKSEGIRYQYIGLKRITSTKSGEQRAPKSPASLMSEFGASMRLILNHQAKLERWQKAMAVLDSDPVFQAAGVSYIDATDNEDSVISSLKKLFKEMSSGHKIVLLTITRLVETVEERTLVLLDEPEAHLHPPLLSAFVRSLSDLLMDRNGVAIIATHSPVVLQEVPRSCVWKLRRSGEFTEIERPELETFGENVSTLTREVFGLEVTESGFHKMLTESIKTGKDYNEIIESYEGQIGQEGRAILRRMVSLRDLEGLI